MRIVESAIRNKKNVITTSYISPELKALEPQINAAGITVLCEAGLDPGIDHLYALKLIGEVHGQGGRIRSFTSNCGGLPAPEASDNPLGLKLSWSPRGILLAALSTARRLVNGCVEEIPGGVQLMDSATPYFILPAFSLLSFPNRDSSIYSKRYEIEEAHTISRGSLRYPGCVEVFKAFAATSLLSQQNVTLLYPSQYPPSWREVIRQVVSADSTSEEWVFALLFLN